jgi:hypothetical protein
VAFIVADPHPNVFPKCNEDAACVFEKAMTVPVQSQKSAGLLVMLTRRVFNSFDSLKFRVPLSKHRHDGSADGFFNGQLPFVARNRRQKSITLRRWSSGGSRYVLLIIVFNANEQRHRSNPN